MDDETRPVILHECCICLMPCFLSENTWTENCGHVFHSCCIEEWAMINKSCPVCRRQLTYSSCKLCVHEHTPSFRSIAIYTYVLCCYVVFLPIIFLIIMEINVKNEQIHGDNIHSNNITQNYEPMYFT